jgi:hypothetical protein
LAQRGIVDIGLEGIIKPSRIFIGSEASSTLAQRGIVNISLEASSTSPAVSPTLALRGIVNIGPEAPTSLAASPLAQRGIIQHATDIAITRNLVKVLFKRPNHPCIHTEGP